MINFLRTANKYGIILIPKTYWMTWYTEDTEDTEDTLL